MYPWLDRRNRASAGRSYVGQRTAGKPSSNSDLPRAIPLPGNLNYRARPNVARPPFHPLHRLPYKFVIIAKSCRKRRTIEKNSRLRRLRTSQWSIDIASHLSHGRWKASAGLFDRARRPINSFHLPNLPRPSWLALRRNRLRIKNLFGLPIERRTREFSRTTATRGLGDSAIRADGIWMTTTRRTGHLSLSFSRARASATIGRRGILNYRAGAKHADSRKFVISNS